MTNTATRRAAGAAIKAAVGVNTDGWREVLGIAAGPSEDHGFWTAFLRALLRRGLKGVVLVISDAHEGLKGAIDKVLHGAPWQRCRVHFMRNLLAMVPKSAAGRWPPSCGPSSPSPSPLRPGPAPPGG